MTDFETADKVIGLGHVKSAAMVQHQSNHWLLQAVTDEDNNTVTFKAPFQLDHAPALAEVENLVDNWFH